MTSPLTTSGKTVGTMRSRSTKPQPVTIERIERALDRLAEIMVKLGPDGVKALPIYQRLETELEALRAQPAGMVAVFERFKRSQDRRAE